MFYYPEDDSGVVRHSLPLQQASNGNGQRSAIKNAWSAVLKSSLRKIWSPLAYDVRDTVKRIMNWNHDQQQVMRSLNHDEHPNQRPVMSSLNHDEHPNQRPVMRSLIELVSHLMLCLTMTILLPISLSKKLVPMKRSLTLTWGWRLAVSCIALSLDALFLYIPFIDEKNKCIGMDKTLRDTTLVLRSLIDLVFAFHIETLIYNRIDGPSVNPDDDLSPENLAAHCIRWRRKWLSIDIIIGLVGILPIPQVTIVIFLFRMRGYENLDKTMIGNIIFILQICVRGYQLYYFQRQLRMLRILTASALYLFRYLLACHILGALWYFYSIQREISCWHQACRNITGCVATSYCKDHNSSSNITLLNEFCPLNSSDATLYDFGIFIGALKSGNEDRISFWTKYIYTFWWSIKNLSNFGTSLETSHYVWGNCFSIIICVVGLVLFIYLLGNMQTYILSESMKALENQQTNITAKFQDLDTWLSRNGILGEEKTEVVKIIKQNEVVETNYSDGCDDAVDLVFVFNAIKVDPIMKLKFFEHFCHNALKKVAIFKHLSLKSDELEALLKVFEPVSYEKDSLVVQEGKADDIMLIITDGVIKCTIRSEASTASRIPKSHFKKGEVYGQELLSRVGMPTLVSDRDVKCETKVEAFALKADKLKDIDGFLKEAKKASKHKSHDRDKANKAYRELTTTRSEKMNRKEKDIREWLSRNDVPDDLQTSVMKHIKANHRHVLEKHLDAEVDVKYLFSIGLSWDIEYDIKKHLCMSTLYKVPVLKSVDENVLHRICMSLEPVILPENNVVFRPGDEIDWMLIIVEGEIKLTKLMDCAHGREERVNVTRVYKGEFFGEKLLISALPETSIPRYRPVISKRSVRCCTKVEAFALTNKGVESVVAYYRDGINEFEQLENGRDHDVADTKGASTYTTIIEQRLEQLIQLQGDMFKQQATIRDEMGRRLDDQGQRLDDQGQRLDELAAFLARLGYPGTPLPPPPAA